MAVAFFLVLSFWRFSRFCYSGFCVVFGCFGFGFLDFAGIFLVFARFLLPVGAGGFCPFFSVLLRLLFPFSFCLRPLGAWGVGGGVVAVRWKLRNVADGVGAFSGEL